MCDLVCAYTIQYRLAMFFTKLRATKATSYYSPANELILSADEKRGRLKKNTFPDYYNKNNEQKYRVDIK